MTRPRHLRVEYLDAGALGIGNRRPRLSWQLPPGAREQVAYRVGSAAWDSDRIEGSECVLVPWGGDPLGSRQRVEWRVKVWTDAGESDWSSPAWFETGLLESADWVARFIEPYEPERADPGLRPAYVLRHEFALDAGAVDADARLYATAHGIYEAFLNGRRVGDLELTPGTTSYPNHLDVQTYAVDDLLVDGTNVWDVVLSDGWYRGRNGFAQVADCYGDTVAFLGQLHVGHRVIATGDGWRSATGSIVAADLMSGQIEDRRRSPTEWQPAAVVAHDLERLTSSPAPPTRRVETIRPVAVTRPRADVQVVDLGQNINGWVRLDDLGPEGTAITLTHGEALDHDGDVTLDNIASFDFFTMQPVTTYQVDRVTSDGRAGAGFEPRHTTHGFQYVRVEGHPHRLTPDDVSGVVVHTDFRRTGWFRCSNERLNRFHEITEWSFRDNACEIPTDCPQRERAGWTGDWQVFIPTGAFLYDVAGFSRKWLRELAAEQLDDGCILNFAPDPYRRMGLEAGGLWRDMLGSSGWGDAIVMVPWAMYRAYGDRRVLAELWPAMVRWIDYGAEIARTQRHPDRAAARPAAAPHEQYLWDGGYHWGEWLEPGVEEHSQRDHDHGAIGTAFLHHSAALAARIGRMLGHDGDADRFDRLAANALAAWRAEFIADDGALTPDTQANHVRALAFGLVPDELRAQTADRLVELIRKSDTHLGTGFLATPYLLPVLADSGHPDVAYELLLQDTVPSWLAMVDRGATTVWERWEGIDDDGTPHASLNHYSKGAAISFLHTHTAGIQILDRHPGYRRFRVAPLPGGGLTWAEAAHDSPYGRIESSWRIVGDRFELVVTVPPGTAAEVVLPDGTSREQPPGTMAYACPAV
jgi:alpha-L-rhamnosidase